MQQGICNPEFYGDLVYEFKKIIGNQNFSDLFKSIVNQPKRAFRYFPLAPFARFIGSLMRLLK